MTRRSFLRLLLRASVAGGLTAAVLRRTRADAACSGAACRQCALLTACDLPERSRAELSDRKEATDARRT